MVTEGLACSCFTSLPIRRNRSLDQCRVREIRLGNLDAFQRPLFCNVRDLPIGVPLHELFLDTPVESVLKCWRRFHAADCIRPPIRRPLQIRVITYHSLYSVSFPKGKLN